MTNHSYFNLAGHDSGAIDSQVLTLEADFYSPNSAGCMPTGEIAKVDGTPFDFRAGKAFGADIAGSFEQISLFGGYDHNFVLSGRGFRRIATVCDPASGRVMEAYTDQPGMQLFTSNGMNIQGKGKNGASYGAHQGFCLETQTFPGADKMPWLVSPFYAKGQEYKTRTAYRFTTMA
jgi:aldose 1-epimerase